MTSINSCVFLENHDLVVDFEDNILAYDAWIPIPMVLMYVGDVKVMGRVCMTPVAICFLDRRNRTISLLAASFLHMAELLSLKVI